jgi:hypothetical protein
MIDMALRRSVSLQSVEQAVWLHVVEQLCDASAACAAHSSIPHSANRTNVLVNMVTPSR